MRDVEILVLGAGVAGLGAAVEARRRGLDGLVLEASSQAGGLCGGTTVAGCRFDRYGPKVIIERESSRELVELLGDNVERHELHEFVYLSDFGLVGFPVQRYLVDLPPQVRAEVLRDVTAARRNPRRVCNYRDWLLNSYGRVLCERVLFPYEEKKWQIPLDEMDFAWALQRPVAVSDEMLSRGATVRLPPSRTYFYPREGSLTSLVDALVELSVPIRFDAEVTAIDLDRHIVSAGGQTYRYQRLVSSLPLDTAVAISDGLPADLRAAGSPLLHWLSTRVYNLVFDGEVHTTGDAVYFPEPSVSFRRVAVLRNLCPRMPAPGRTSVTVEVASRVASGPAATLPSLDEIVAQLRTVPEFAAFGPLVGSDVVDIAAAYPLQRDGLRDHVKQLADAYRKWDVWHCGRGGTFNYCDLDVAYHQGRAATRDAFAEGDAWSF